MIEGHVALFHTTLDWQELDSVSEHVGDGKAVERQKMRNEREGHNHHREN